MLKIEGLRASVGGKQVLQGVNLTLRPGEIHAIMGPNGSGKSTLSRVIAGSPGYQGIEGILEWNGESLLGLVAEERAARGVFLGFQYPVEVAGVTNRGFLRMVYNAQRKRQGLEQVDPIELQQLLAEKLQLVGLKEDFLTRSLNHGFSGGEKKRNEILQLALLQPPLVILDEIDSGLDIDAVKAIAQAINATHNSQRCLLLITHYQRILNFIKPDFVHIMRNGLISQSGDASLAQQLEQHGYQEGA